MLTAVVRLRIFTSTTPVKRDEVDTLRADLAGLSERFRKLWLDRNPSLPIRPENRLFSRW